MESPDQTPARVAEQVFAALNDRDLERFAALAADDVVDDFLAVGEFRGRAAVVDFFSELLGAVPDFAIVVEALVADDHSAAVKWRATGSFTGTSFQGIDANGRHIDLRGIDFMDIEAGQVVRNRIAYDGASFARQVGLLPSAGSLPDRAVLAVFNAKTRGVDWWRSRNQAASRRQSPADRDGPAQSEAGNPAQGG